MTNSKITKRTFWGAVLSLILCVSMLVGTTFAWFTDTASTAVNSVQSGTLDIELQYQKDDGSWANAEGTTLSFKKNAAAPAGEKILWEPGCTYELPAVKVVNKGNLAVKYQIAISGIDGDAKLNEVIDWTYNNQAVLTSEGTLLADKESEPITIKGHMQETANNDYQNLTIDGIAITVYATQLAYEYDSFGNEYDAGADYDGEISSQASLLAAFKNGGSYKVVGDVTLDESMTVPAGVEIALNLGGYAINGNIEIEQGASLTIENGTVSNDDDTVSGIQTNGGNLTLNNVEIDSARHAVRVEGGTVVINGGVYRTAAKSNKTIHAVNVSDGGTVIINDGTFIGPKGTVADSGSAVNVQSGSTAIINGGTFSNGLNNTLASKGILTVYGGTFDQNPQNFVATGRVVTVNADGTYTVSATKVTSSSELSAAISSGKAVELTEDIKYSSSISNDADIDLAGNTFEATTTLTLTNNSNLTVTDGDYTANGTYGHIDVRPSSAEGSEVVFENVNFSYNKKNNTFGPSTNRLGSVVEFCAITEGSKSTFVFKNCTFNNAQIVFEGMSGKTGEFEAIFENCTFNALTSSAPIYVQNYVKGTLNIVNCTFNLECTSSTASAVSISSSTSTSVVVNAKNNTINATAATPYTFDAAKGETSVDNVKVNGTPANIKFIMSYGNSTVTETGTVKTGIAK